MNYVKLFENFQLVPKRILNTGNDKFFGEKADDDYVQSVRKAIRKIALEEHGSNETVLKETEMQLVKEDQQLDAIIHNCKSRNFRPQYAAEVAFYALVNGRIEALKDREPMFGGLKEGEVYKESDQSKKIKKNSKVTYKKKNGKVVDFSKEKVDGEIVKTVKIQYEDGTTSWEVADDKNLKLHE